MLEDKKLKELLQENLMEETSIDFTLNVMGRVEANITKQNAVSPAKQKLLKILIAVFLFVCIALVVLSNVMQPVTLPWEFSFLLSKNYFSQIISFLIVFWIVMIINQLINKRHFNSYM